MDMDKRILKLLYRSFDSNLRDKKRQQLTDALKKSQELQKEKERIFSMRQAVSESARQSFLPLFAERVMSQLNSVETKEKTLVASFEAFRAIFKRFALIAFLILIGLVSYNLLCSDFLSKDDICYVPTVTLAEILPPPLF
jgi:hypothetical protein